MQPQATQQLQRPGHILVQDSDQAIECTSALLARQLAEQAAELTSARSELTKEMVERRRIEDELRALTVTLEQRVADHTRELTALYSVSTVANRAETLDSLLNESLAEAVRALRSEAGAIFLADETGSPNGPLTLRVAAHQGIPPELLLPEQGLLTRGGVLDAVARQGTPLLIPDVTADMRLPLAMRSAGAKALLMTPLRVQGEPLGLAILMRRADQGYNIEDVALLTTIADQVGVAVHRLRLRELVQQRTKLEERQRLGRDLHDTITQSLYGLVTLTEAGQAQVDAMDLHSARRTLTCISETILQTLKEIRLFIHQLRPDVLRQEGLAGALQLRLAAVEGHAGIQARMLTDEVIDLPLPVENALYQIAQEALNNILRHARCNSIAVRLFLEQEDVVLEIEDDGLGFDPGAIGNGGMGLGNMRALAREVGGTFDILSIPGGGTKVRVTVKLDGREQCV